MQSLAMEICSLHTAAIDRFYDPQYETQLIGEGKNDKARRADPSQPSPFEFTQVGCNGWNQYEGTADYIVYESDAYDPDKQHGGNPQTDEQMQANDARLAGRAHISRSTGGRGRHYRVEVVHPDGSKVRCPDRATYNALSRFVCHAQGMTDKTCAKGGFLWVGPARNNLSFEILSEQTEPFIVPFDWAPPKRTCQIRGNRVTLTLSERHESILSTIEEAGYPVFMDQFEDGVQYFKTHTCGLKAAHAALKLRGWFDTISAGTDPSSPNCYMLLAVEGFQVFRFGDTNEPGWNKRESDQRSWLWIDQFEESDWRSLCSRFQGTQKQGTHKNRFLFADAADATTVIQATGGTIEVPRGPAEVLLKDSCIYCNIPAEGNCPDGWVQDGKVFSKSCVISTTGGRNSGMPEYARIAYHWSEQGEQTSETLHYIQHGDGTWKPEAESRFWDVVSTHEYYTSEDVQYLRGKEYRNPLKIVYRPFVKTDDPLIWNRGYQFACDPTPGEHPHWDLVLNHTGRYLTQYVEENSWCQANGIRDGRDFLLCYLAKTVQDPARRLPQLFLYSAEQSTGKDTFPCSIALLMEPGAVVDANNAATSGQGFNSELQGAVVYVINELDLSKSGSKAESNVRQWVTDYNLTVHPKGMKPYQVSNYGRVIQMANDLSYKSVDAEDERVIVIQMPVIPRESQLDWKDELEPALIRERAAFLHTLLNYSLPEKGAKGSRCYLPILMTEAKQQSIQVGLDKASPLSADDTLLLNTILSHCWDGLLEFEHLPKEVTGGFDSASWSAAWKRLNKHLKARGLRPTDRPFIKRKQKAAWGFETRAS